MKREKAKDCIRLLNAWVDGKTIQFRIGEGWIDAAESDCETIGSDVGSSYEWRIKPEPKLRPWKPEEVPVGAVVINKGTGNKYLITAVSMDGDTRPICIGWISAGVCSCENLFEGYTQLDGKPCGVEESQ